VPGYNSTADSDYLPQDTTHDEESDGDEAGENHEIPQVCPHARTLCIYLLWYFGQDELAGLLSDAAVDLAPKTDA
jgi:hypothetical protein